MDEQRSLASRVVADMLAEHRVRPEDAASALGINLAHHHVAVMLWAHPNEQDAGERTAIDRLSRLGSALAHALDARRSPVVPVGRAEMWMWLTWPQAPKPRLAARARKRLSPPDGVRASIGPVTSGKAGFSRSHVGARAAARVARSRDMSTSWIDEYADVAIVALLTSDPEQAQWFMAEVLGPLAQSGRRFDELRETLRVYLAFGRSRLRAAETLHVARNTVAYRVGKAVKLLGRPIDEDPVKVRLALEIAHVLLGTPARLAGDATEQSSVTEMV